MDSRDADHTATTERWQLWQLHNVQDAVREVAFQQAAAEDLEVAYRLQLDEIMMEVESDALCSMFEEDLEDWKLRRAALQAQVSLHAWHMPQISGLKAKTDCCNRWQYSRVDRPIQYVASESGACRPSIAAKTADCKL